MQLIAVKIDKPEAINFILGQTHFIKSVEDIHEALVGAVPGAKFGLAFCEASGKCLVRWSGTDPAMVEPRRNKDEVSWAWWTGSIPKTSKARTKSSGARICCGSSATSFD